MNVCFMKKYMYTSQSYSKVRIRHAIPLQKSNVLILSLLPLFGWIQLREKSDIFELSQSPCGHPQQLRARPVSLSPPSGVPTVSLHCCVTLFPLF